MSIVSESGYAPEFHADTALDPVRVAVSANPKAPTVLGRTAEIQQQTNKAYGEHLQRVQQLGSKLTAEGHAVALDSFTNEPIWAQAQEAEAQAEQRVKELEVEVGNERKALSPGLDAAGELRAQRALDRARLQLSRIEGPGRLTAAAKLVREADAETVGVLISELPELCEIPTAAIEDEVRARAPEYAAAAAKLAKAQQGQAIVKSNGAKLRKAIGEERRQSVGILGLEQPSGHYDPDA
jgi:hypothetical protein